MIITHLYTFKYFIKAMKIYLKLLFLGKCVIRKSCSELKQSELYPTYYSLKPILNVGFHELVFSLFTLTVFASAEAFGHFFLEISLLITIVR